MRVIREVQVIGAGPIEIDPTLFDTRAATEASSEVADPRRENDRSPSRQSGWRAAAPKNGSPDSPQPILLLPGHTAHVFGVAFSPSTVVSNGVGTVAFVFNGNDAGTMTYNVGGISRSVMAQSMLRACLRTSA